MKEYKLANALSIFFLCAAVAMLILDEPAMAEASKNDNVRSIDNPFTGDAFDEINKILKGDK